MKKPLAILLVFSLLSPYFVSAQSDPCQDKEFLRLKDVSINDMSEREYKYFMMMSEKCADDDKDDDENDDDVSATMQDIYEKEKKRKQDMWTMIEIMIIFFLLRSLIPSNDYEGL